MLAKSMLAVALAALAACSARGDGEGEHEPSLPDVPDDLLAVPDPRSPLQTLSLREGTVLGALTTAPTVFGEPAALVYRCRPDAAGAYRWTVSPDAGLTPLGPTAARRLGAARPRALAEIAGEVDAQARSPNPRSVPLYRYRTGRGLYVLRLDTRGGLGPADEGAACAPDTADVRSAISADFYFVAVPGDR